MDALKGDIRAVSPDDPEISAILVRHLALMRASSPACSVHAMDGEALIAGGVEVFGLSSGGAVVAIGGLKRLGPDHGEIKSMHVLEAERGRGHARAMLAYLVGAARAAGLSRLSLETGSQPAFAPARALYASEGFAECAPFAEYRPDPASVFMTRAL